MQNQNCYINEAEWILSFFNEWIFPNAVSVIDSISLSERDGSYFYLEKNRVGNGALSFTRQVFLHTSILQSTPVPLVPRDDE